MDDRQTDSEHIQWEMDNLLASELDISHIISWTGKTCWQSWMLILQLFTNLIAWELTLDGMLEIFSNEIK